MSLGLLFLILLALCTAGYMIARSRAVTSARGDTRVLHSLPAFHGRFAALAMILPAVAILIVWLVVESFALRGVALSHLSPEDVPDGASMDLVMADVTRIAEGLGKLQAAGVDLAPLTADPAALKARFSEAGFAQGGDPTPHTIAAAVSMRDTAATSRLALSVVAIAASLAGLGLVLRRITPEFRARNATEFVSMGLLIGASLIAVLTTVGIVASLASETIRFFQLYPAWDFFFSADWNPKFGGGSSLGIWPLIWGTLYVSVIALLVAVPVGLFSAVYLAEYASKRTRGIVKPLIEILAGIPTIVYGLFALVTVGPLLRDWIAIPMGFGNSSSSVMTAGLVMGIMVIPFVSSLSDDIINAVPQSLRDGSLGLGATPSETIRQVVLPAALPGIVGAVLLAASRAIGETMIVVLGAGAAAQLSLNPFEAMTTVTVKIVSQLTGDTEFNSPETLVAFALGLTLFVLTLMLNIIALIIVRKYREQYE
ncbi:phosphate ABC transporter permease subunit PstC [Rhodobacter sp. KR11]|uniref:phosphate ABC transporter permease subunit PstC n=1 Tax=Rhodobacter sp. KR11 TaxID=2974588 RepID=UPI002221BC89|nr:phosphate ABC transporter permease subunit PstC [Rhodobacter sp. KR11]MCW1919435.1 phosphate ABC transporter permease subunit PstC [Rhodobacter sp. KR11]